MESWRIARFEEIPAFDEVLSLPHVFYGLYEGQTFADVNIEFSSEYPPPGLDQVEAKRAEGVGLEKSSFSATTAANRVRFQKGPNTGGGTGLIKIDCKLECGMCRDCFPIIGCRNYPCCELSDCRIVIGK